MAKKPKGLNRKSANENRDRIPETGIFGHEEPMGQEAGDDAKKTAQEPDRPGERERSVETGPQ